VTEDGMFDKIFKEIHTLGYRSSVFNFIIEFKMFCCVGFVSVFVKLPMPIHSLHTGFPSTSAFEQTAKAKLKS
jgi:hypothetical protein